MREALALLRRQGDFRRTYLATLVSLGGDWFAVVPLLALLPRLTGGGLAGGLVLVADTAVFALLSPYAGTVADRVDRRRLLVAADLASAGCALLLLLVTGPGTAWVAVAAVGGIAACKAFAQPASQAALPNLVDRSELRTANVLTGTAWGTMLAVGAALGGLGAAVLGERACFLVDAGSFLVSALLVARCRRPFQRPRAGTGARPGFRADVAEAVRYARGEPRVLALVTAKPGVGPANGALVLFPLLALDVFDVGGTGIGLLFAARGLGAVLGPLVLGRPRSEAAVHRLLALCIGGCGLAYVAAAAAPSFALVLLLVVVAHVGGGANWVVSTYGLQAVVPDRVLGRVASADLMLVTLAVVRQPARVRRARRRRAHPPARRRLRRHVGGLRRHLVARDPAGEGRARRGGARPAADHHPGPARRDREPGVAVPSYAPSPVVVRAPATSANLGPAFDSAGLCLGLADEVVAEVTASGLVVQVEGEGAGALPLDERHLLVRAARAAFERLGGSPPGLRVHCVNRVPQSRGLGSSSAAIVAGVLAARALVDGGEELLDDDAVLALADEIEGHPDNVAACLRGGFTLAWRDAAGVHVVRRDVAEAVVPVVLVPQQRSSTAQVRGLLPATVPHADAAAGAARAALLALALTSDPSLLLAATQDRLHQPYRAAAMPGTARLVAELRERGTAAVVSGAGPTVLALCTRDEVDAVVRSAPDGWTARRLAVDAGGARADRT